MADDNPTDNNDESPDTGQDTEQQGDPEALGDPGKKALDAERQARRDAEKAAKELREKLQAIEDAEKSDLERAQEAASTAEQRAKAAERRLMVLEVASDKGLTPAQAKRLTGDSKEELEADADELLELLTPPEQEPPPGGRPKALHNGNGTGDDKSFDPQALANAIYERRNF